MRLSFCLLTSAFCLLAGCRTAGPQICIRDSHDIDVRIAGGIDAQQGKTVSPDTSLAASVAATLRDITAAQGDATRTGESGASATAATATALPGTAEPQLGSAPLSDPAEGAAKEEPPAAVSGGGPAAGPTTDTPAAVAAPVAGE